MTSLLPHSTELSSSIVDHPPNCTTNNKSIDSLILNSPSSLHRLQTLTRKQRTPLSNRPSYDPSDRINSIDFSTSPDVLSSPVNGGGGILSSASSMLYLSDVCSSTACSPEQSSLTSKPAKGYGYEYGCPSGRSSTPFTTSSSIEGSHSIAYYLNMHRLDRFLRLTHFTIRLAFYLLPLLWALVAVTWIVYLRAQNRYLKAQLLLDDDSSSDVSSPESISEPNLEHSVAAWCTVSTLVATVFFAAAFVVKSHWAYSFEFVPTEDEECTEDMETTTSTSVLPLETKHHFEALPLPPSTTEQSVLFVEAAEVEGPIKVNVIADDCSEGTVQDEVALSTAMHA